MDYAVRSIFKRRNFDDDLKNHRPGDFIEIVNGRINASESSKSGSVTNLKGTTEVTYSKPAGDNKVIGVTVNEKDGSLVFFMYNSNGDHGIYRYRPLSGSSLPGESPVKNLIQWNGLGFTSDMWIKGAIIDDLLYWVDNKKIKPQRMLNIKRAIDDDFYNALSPIYEESISVLKVPPKHRAAVTKLHDSGIQSDKVSGKNFQFAYRYIYLDNEKSVFSPVSEIAPAYIVSGAISQLANIPNKIQFTVEVQDEVLESVKSIEVAFREGNYGEYKIFKTIDNPSSSNVIIFKNDTSAPVVSSNESSKAFESIPRYSTALEIIKDRLFLKVDEEGFTVEEGSVTLSATLQDNSANGFEDVYDRFLKDGGEYNIAIHYFDDKLRKSGVKSKISIKVPQPDADDSTNNFTVDGTKRKKVRVTISGTPPEKAHYYQLAMTDNRHQELFVQCAANVLFYVSEYDDGDNIAGTETVMEGRIYLKDKPADTSGFNYLHFQLPENLPIKVDKNYIVKILTDATTYSPNYYPILDVVDNDIIVLEKSIKSDYTSFPEQVLIEIYRPVEVPDDLYYEASPIYAITNPGLSNRAFSTIQVTLRGDTYYVYQYAKDTPYIYRTLKVKEGQAALAYSLITKQAHKIETPTPTHNAELSSVKVELETTRKKKKKNFLQTVQFLFGGPVTEFYSFEREFIFNTGFTLDYSKRDSDKGRLNTEIINERSVERKSTVRYSDPYVQGTLINGLSSYDTANQYVLPTENGDVIWYQRAKNVLLAIHPASITSLYTGEGVLKAGEDNIIVKTESVIGDDNDISHVGSINPESIVEFDGVVYGFDLINGVVWRYAQQAGVFPISNYKMRGFFKNKKDIYLPYRDSAKIVAGFDPHNHEYIITFPAISGVVDAETVVFNEDDNEWKQTIENTDINGNTPDAYGRVGDDLISFMQGRLWLHYKNDNYNLFYGDQKRRRVKFAVAPDPRNPMIWNNLWLHANKDDICADGTLPVIFKNDKGQESFMYKEAFVYEENSLRGPVGKDRNTPGINGNHVPYVGDEMRSEVLEVEIINDLTTLSPLWMVTTLFNYSEVFK